METFEIVEKPYGWVLRFGAEVVGTFSSKLDAVEQANWLCRKLRDTGAKARVLLDA